MKIGTIYVCLKVPSHILVSRGYVEGRCTLFTCCTKVVQHEISTKRGVQVVLYISTDRKKKK